MIVKKLQQSATELSTLLQCSKKEAYTLLDVDYSRAIGKPKIDIFKLDIFLGIANNENTISTASTIKDKYGEEALKHIQSLI